MRHSVRQAIEARTSAHHYDPDRPLSDAVIEDLVTQATRAPSAYNLQNWRFVAVRSLREKERLQVVAYGQRKITDASVAFIVCGTLAAHAGLTRTLQPSVDAGLIGQRIADGWAADADAAYAANPGAQRDEAIRSASLAGMTLMLAAQGMGLASCPMTGFDATALAQTFGLHPDDVPVLVVTVGHGRSSDSRQKLRKPLAEVLRIL